MSKASIELYPGQRTREKREFFRRYQVSAVQEQYKRRFYHLFGNSCYKCGRFADPSRAFETRRILCMDHHLPMALGGHLVPGNIVSLCRRCNGLKLDRHPSAFYTESELHRLQPLLDQQDELFSFTFNWDKWSSSREEYLLSLGIEAILVHDILYNQEHPDFAGTGSDRLGVVISVSGVDRL